MLAGSPSCERSAGSIRRSGSEFYTKIAINFFAEILNPAIGVMENTRRWIAPGDRHLQCRQRQFPIETPYQDHALDRTPDLGSKEKMRGKIVAVTRFVFTNFGPMIVFYGVNLIYGLKPAIVSSTVFSLSEIVLTLYRKRRITTIFKFSAATTLAFGVVDLYGQQSSLFKYEASFTNVLTGIFFGASIFADRTLLQEFYEQRMDAKVVNPDLAAFFRLLTLVWAIYFFSKAVAYFWIAQKYSLEQGLLIRAIIGSGSFYGLLALSIFGSRKIFLSLKAIGFFQTAVTAPPEEISN